VVGEAVVDVRLARIHHPIRSARRMAGFRVRHTLRPGYADVGCRGGKTNGKPPGLGNELRVEQVEDGLVDIPVW